MNIVVLTGAGISAESGLATFRDLGGIWSQVKLEEVATPEGFAADPERVQAFYNARRAQLREVEPNAAHHALARLEREWRKGSFLLVTQNVDDLHDRAGSQALLHMHGELRRARCLACGTDHRWEDPITAESACPGCGARGRLRPHVVWFGEMPLHMERIEAALANCDLFIAIGTSAQVWPAAGFVRMLPRRARGIEVNPERSAMASSFAEGRRGLATQEVPRLVEELLA
ncbi:NAD-dependent deacylase [Sabulicella glaciei]|uniref:NAD-dependent protein deacylase n=1 Tax=Sabulicella glaciei TaxID=2984948 RepID=A0ABT3NY75_9PROT|nr:NAD-dependent deacylase [Roseococcus sp. MDT2-1-1]MCW8087117.1 NAD-dependent deacylase [Roseococcus sp. MDT2-1-1]